MVELVFIILFVLTMFMIGMLLLADRNLMNMILINDKRPKVIEAAILKMAKEVKNGKIKK